MGNRGNILAAVKKNQPDLLQHPGDYTSSFKGSLSLFQRTLEGVGGSVHYISTEESVTEKVKILFPSASNVLSVLDSVKEYYLKFDENKKGHSFEQIELAIMEAAFGVAENGAVWITETHSAYRVLPFIAQHLMVIINESDLVSDMNEAYKRIGNEDYSFGVFIAGPSKTADIEQSLVLGAHGPKTMTVLIRSAG